MNWGLLGYGRIAKKMEESLLSQGHNIVGVASRSKYDHIPKNYLRYDNYENLLNNKDIDIVYVSTTHNTHAHHTINALNKGKHVLCEKPLAISPGEVDAMFAAAQENDCFLMEALWSRYLPAYEKALTMIRSGEIGDVHFISAHFGFKMDPNKPKERLIQPELAAGAIWDVGIYPLSIIQDIYESDPIKINTQSKLSPLGVEVKCIAQLSYSNDRFAQFSCGIDNTTINKALISGSKGSIEMEDFWKCERFTLQNESGKCDYYVPMNSNGLIHEAEACVNLIEQGQLASERISYQHSRQLSKIMEEIIHLARRS